MFSLFRKKEVPESLPNLAAEEVSLSLKTSEQDIKRAETSYKPLPANDLLIPQLAELQIPTSEQKTATENVQDKSKWIVDEQEKGFFKDLIKSVTEETENLDKLDAWYKNKFLPGDIVYQMREYWERQQPELLMKNVSGELKNKLMEKTNKLHKLESDWQETYFVLLSKEEQIRKEEKELKDALSEFISLFKNSSGKKEKAGPDSSSKVKN
jgi:hypothetical protein